MIRTNHLSVRFKGMRRAWRLILCISILWVCFSGVARAQWNPLNPVVSVQRESDGVQLTLKNGDIRTYYLDTDTYLELKLETKTFIRGAPQESETYYGDYEQVGGMYFPFAIESGQKGDPERVVFTVEKVEINVPVEDSLFAMPAAPRAKPPGVAK